MVHQQHSLASHFQSQQPMQHPQGPPMYQRSGNEEEAFHRPDFSSTGLPDNVKKHFYKRNCSFQKPVFYCSMWMAIKFCISTLFGKP